MASTKPYFLRAIHEWCTDQGFAPYLQVAVDARARVPLEYVKDGQIVLNLSHEATQRLTIGNDDISFQARFNGIAFSIVVPVDAVLAIYARENGQGMHFGEAAASAVPASSAATEIPVPPAPDFPNPGKPRLTRIK